LLLGLLLLGCSAARLGYHNGEFVAYWWLDGYIDVEHEQRPLVKSRIASLFAWHHKTQLKSYAQVLARAQKRIEQPVTDAELLADYEDVKRRLLVIADRALPDMADLALALEPQQIAHLEKKFESNNNDFRKDFLRGDVEQRQRFRYKKVLKQAETWFGGFSNAQEQQIRAASDARPLNNELVMAERLQRQKAIVALLKKIQAEKPSREATMAMLKELINQIFDRFGDAEQKAFAEKYNAATARLTALIVNISNSEQKAHFVKTTQQWIDDFEAMAK
jgi:hypothetical protein